MKAMSRHPAGSVHQGENQKKSFLKNNNLCVEDGTYFYYFQAILKES